MTDKNIEAKSALLVEKNGAVTTISINDAPWNRMSLEFMNELEALVDSLAGDKSIRAVVITGAGDEHFSVGMHLKQMAGSIKSRGDLESILDQRLRVLAAIEKRKPIFNQEKKRIKSAVDCFLYLF